MRFLTPCLFVRYNPVVMLQLDAGARKVLLPSENKRDLADVPDEILSKIQPVFYTDPINASIRAMGLE